MGVTWVRLDPSGQEPQIQEQESMRAFEQRINSYISLGWKLVKRQEDPPVARLVYRQRRSAGPSPSVNRDTGDRVIWVDETGEVRVERTGG